MFSFPKQNRREENRREENRNNIDRQTDSQSVGPSLNDLETFFEKEFPSWSNDSVAEAAKVARKAMDESKNPVRDPLRYARRVVENKIAEGSFKPRQELDVRKLKNMGVDVV